MSQGAVITADIVNSTKLSKTDMKKIMKNITLIFSNHKIEFFRGDSFQVYMKLPGEALLAILISRTAAIKLSAGISDIKASIGIDSVKIPVRDLNTASGEAFVLSGRSFDSMKNGKRLSIVCNEKYDTVNTGLRILCQFTDYLFQHLTFKQAAVVHELLLGKSQVEISRKIRKSQATVHKHIQSAGWPETEKLLSEYTLLINSIKN